MGNPIQIGCSPARRYISKYMTTSRTITDIYYIQNPPLSRVAHTKPHLPLAQYLRLLFQECQLFLVLKSSINVLVKFFYLNKRFNFPRDCPENSCFCNVTVMFQTFCISGIRVNFSPLITSPPLFFGMSKNFSKVSKGKSKTDNFLPPLVFGKIVSKGVGELSLL